MVDLILPIFFILKPLGYLQRFLLILVSPAHALSQERLKGSFASGVSPNPSKPATLLREKLLISLPCLRKDHTIHCFSIY